jgi:hypothetical protein
MRIIVLIKINVLELPLKEVNSENVRQNWSKFLNGHAVMQSLVSYGLSVIGSDYSHCFLLSRRAGYSHFLNPKSMFLWTPKPPNSGEGGPCSILSLPPAPCPLHHAPCTLPSEKLDSLLFLSYL